LKLEEESFPTKKRPPKGNEKNLIYRKKQKA
jgi:hypothetical protein